jgi:hypothetical protein
MTRFSVVTSWNKLLKGMLFYERAGLVLRHEALPKDLPSRF